MGAADADLDLQTRRQLEDQRALGQISRDSCSREVNT